MTANPKLRRVDPSVSRTPLSLEVQGAATVCVLCSHNCGVRVDTRDGRITAVRADESNPITRGYVCNKAFSIPKYANHAQRVTHPMRRRADGSFERISWDRAIDEIGGRLLAIRDAHGPRAISLVGIGGQANHMDAAFGLGFLTGLGSRRWFNAFAQEKTQHPLVDGWMCEASPGVMLHPDAEHTDVMLMFGTNPKVTHRGERATKRLAAFARDDSKTLVVVDPRETETTRTADRHLQVRPGCDAWLLAGLAAAVVQDGHVDRSFVAHRTSGFTELEAALSAISIDDMAARSGIDAAAIRAVAELFATAGHASIFFDLGVEQIPYSTLASWLIRVLLALTGNLGQPGGNVFLEAFAPPGAGKLRGEPERALVSGIPAIRALGNYGMFSPNLFPEEVLHDHPERIRAVIVEGSNPLLSMADTARWREAFERLDLKVVIDPAMTETAHLADYVLPAPVGYEKWEWCGFPKGFPQVATQVRPPVVPGPDEALPEPEIYVRLAERMKLFGDPPPILRHLARRASSSDAAATAFTVATMTLAGRAAKRHGGGTQNRIIFWSYRTLGRELSAPSLVAPFYLCLQNAVQRRAAVLNVLGPSWRYKSPFAIGRELFERLMEHPEGAVVAALPTTDNLARNVGHADGRVRLFPEPMRGELERLVADPATPDPAWPLTLSAGFRTRWTANTIHRDPSWRKGKGPHATLRVHPDDAADLGLQDGDTARVVTTAGRADAPVQVDDAMLPGHVALPNLFRMEYQPHPGAEVIVTGVRLNELTPADRRDPFTGVPWHKAVPCRVERA